MYNSGFKSEAKVLAKKFYSEFKEFDYIVAPSGSCISMVKNHYKDLLQKDEFEELSKKSFEICEFLHDDVSIKMGEDKLANFKKSGAEFLVGYDNSCLMHLASLDKGVKMLHVVEILSGLTDESF